MKRFISFVLVAAFLSAFFGVNANVSQMGLTPVQGGVSMFSSIMAVYAMGLAKVWCRRHPSL
jgi:hypothetical protein